jgi:hypothetical protein
MSAVFDPADHQIDRIEDLMSVLVQDRRCADDSLIVLAQNLLPVPSCRG